MADPHFTDVVISLPEYLDQMAKGRIYMIATAAVQDVAIAN